MSQTKAQLISDLVQALNFTGTSSAPANGMYLSAANTIKLATNSNGRLTIDSSGNMGLAITPDTQGATVDSLQIGSVTNLYNESSDDYTILGNNIYFDGTNNKYIKTQESSRFMQNAGQFWFQQAGSGSADANITYTTPLFIKTGGNVGIGTTDPSVPLNVLTTATDAALFESTAGDANGVQLSLRATSASPADDDKLAVLDFSGKDDAGNNTTYAQIRSHSKDVTNNSEDGDITFHTRHNGSFAERLNLRSSGQLAITKANDGVVSGALQINTTLANYGTIQVRDSNQANIAALQVENANDGTNETNKVIRSVNLGSANWANAAYHAKEHKFRISGETDTENVVLINTTGLDIASAKLLTTGRANIQKGLRTSPTMLVGANDGGSGMNQNSSKHVNICCPQYLSDTQTGGFRLLSGYAGDGTNYCYLGGSDDNITATATHPKNATELRLFTSATATGNGVERLRIDSSGVSTFAGKIAINTVARIESTGEFKAAHGTEATPSYNFLNDNDNGMYRITTNEIGFSTGGTKALTIHSDQKVTFESAIGIGMASGGSTLAVDGNIYLGAGGNTSWAKAGFKGSNNTTGSDLSINNWGDAEGDYWTIGVNSTSNASGNTAKTNDAKRSVSVLLDGRMGRMVLETSQTSTATRDTTHTWDRSGDYTLTGNINLADTKGINFSANTSDASPTSELLDDYEEGNFTVGFWASSGNFTTNPTLVNNNGRYTKIGRQVSFSVYVSWSNNGAGGSGNIYMSGLPFTQNNNSVYSGVHFGWWELDSAAMSSDQTLTGYLNNNQSYVVFYKNMVGAGTGGATMNVNDFMNGKSGNMQVNGTYYV